MKISLTTALIFLFSNLLLSQQITEFSESPNAYIKELGDYMKAGKSKIMEDIFNDFEKIFKSGIFSKSIYLRVETQFFSLSFCYRVKQHSFKSF